MRVKSPEEYERKYIEKSFLSFIAGKRWGQKEMSIKQIIGMIRETSLRGDRLAQILFTYQDFPKDEEERQKFDSLILELRNLGYL